MVDEAVGGRCRAALSSPAGCPGASDSSLIQLSFWPLADEPLDEEVDGAAVCRVQAEVRAASLSSSGVVMERTMSCGVNFSVTVMKWTATRAGSGVSAGLSCQSARQERRWAHGCRHVGRTLEQARGAFGDVLDEHLAAAVQQQAIQWRLVLVLCDGSACLVGPASSRGEDVNGIPCRVLEQEPVRNNQHSAAGDCDSLGVSHHPPASASALWYACVTATSSSPLSDMVGAQGLRWKAAAGRAAGSRQRVQQPRTAVSIGSCAAGAKVLRAATATVPASRSGRGDCEPPGTTASQAGISQAIGTVRVV